MTNIICGVDVAKATLVCAVEGVPGSRTFANGEVGHGDLVAWLGERGVGLVVFEGTGGYERPVARALAMAGIAYAIVEAGRVRAFARAEGLREKTDALDAALIARFARALAVVPTPPPGLDQRRLAALRKRRAQLVQDRSDEKRRLKAIDADDPAIADVVVSIAEHMAMLDRIIARLEGEMASLIDDDPVLAGVAAAMQAMPGVGPRTAETLLADMPEIGAISSKAAAKLAGLAPLADDSGERRGKRRIRGGRASIRTSLFNIAMGVANANPAIADFARRLKERGLKALQIWIAVARKVLVILNAKARDARKEIAMAT